MSIDAPAARFGWTRIPSSSAAIRSPLILTMLRGVAAMAAYVCGLDGETQPRGETHGAEHPQVVLAEPLVRIADGPDDAFLKVGLPAHVVDDLLLERVVEHAVDREVAPAGVLGGASKHQRTK